MFNDTQTIEQPTDVFNTVMEDSLTTITEVECPTCGFNSKPVNNKEYECLHGHRFKE
jgi:hypothetical protein